MWILAMFLSIRPGPVVGVIDFNADYSECLVEHVDGSRRLEECPGAFVAYVICSADDEIPTTICEKLPGAGLLKWGL